MNAASSARHSSSVDLVTMLLVLAGDHQASANANAVALLRLVSGPVDTDAESKSVGRIGRELPRERCCEIEG